MSFDEIVSSLAKKWQEVPAGADTDGRRQSADMMLKPLDEWENLFKNAAELRGWWWRLYAPQFKGKRVLEIGSGMGFDAVHFASAGAEWTCCDIVQSNLHVITRVSEARGLRIKTLLIEGLASFDQLSDDYDAVWANGSLINLPFADAQAESHAIIQHLKPHGRWIELAYPRERWVREGSPEFSKWGTMTDGEGTPWVEWYDLERLKQRLFPHRLLPVLDLRFSGDSYIWIEAEIAGTHAQQAKPIHQPKARARFSVPSGLWRDGELIPLASYGPLATVEVDCTIWSGSVGFTLVRAGKNISREAYAESRAGSQLLYLSTDGYGDDVQLSTRNVSALGSAQYTINSVTIRQSL